MKNKQGNHPEKGTTNPMKAIKRLLGYLFRGYKLQVVIVLLSIFVIFVIVIIHFAS